ncbi:MAG: phosphoglycolate phosphatase [Burkholderiales bacterium]|jgi:phosphoglycolate phosphatase
MASFEALLFDLDGTLLDTAKDLVQSGHAVREAMALAPLSDARVLSFVGKGAERFVHRLLTDDLDGDAKPDVHAQGMNCFDSVYEQYNGFWAKPFEGVIEGLERLHVAKVPMAVVTNKAQSFTEALLERSNLNQYFRFAIGGDAIAHKKPHPQPLLEAARRLGVSATSVWMLGDSANDAQAARAAGMRVYLLPYGYREGVALEHIPCDGIVQSIDAFAQWTLQSSYRSKAPHGVGGAGTNPALGSDA